MLIVFFKERLKVCTLSACYVRPAHKGYGQGLVKVWAGTHAQVNPQFYAFRWITLLLTQEFPFPDAVSIPL